MNYNYLQTRFEYIDSIIDYFSSLNLDEQLKSHVSQYLTVLISGIYEDMIKNLVKEFIFKQSVNNEIKSFIDNQISYIFRNPEFKNIKDFLNRFNKSWCDKLTKEIQKENFEALDSIVNNKNLIAHGLGSPITFEDISVYYEKSKCILEKLDSIILNDNSIQNIELKDLMSSLDNIF